MSGFDTNSGEPFYFDFRRSGVGNTVVIGQVGSGKCALPNDLMSQMQGVGAAKPTNGNVFRGRENTEEDES